MLAGLLSGNVGASSASQQNMIEARAFVGSAANNMWSNTNAGLLNIANGNVCATHVSEQNMIEARASVGTVDNNTNSSIVQSSINALP